MIRVSGVTKMFGSLAAVRDVTFEVGTDEIVGLVGPNGAGKTTLLRMLASTLFPSTGELFIDGISVLDSPIQTRQRIGYLPGDTPLYQEMRPFGFLDFISRAYGLSPSDRDNRLQWVVGACGLQEVEGKRIKECSTGFRKRIGLAAALIHDPPVLLLDEPTHGLDPLQILAWRQLLLTLKPGRSIILSSHVISDIAAICDRLIVMHSGRILADERLESLRERVGTSSDDLERWIVELMMPREREAANA